VSADFVGKVLPPLTDKTFEELGLLGWGPSFLRLKDASGQCRGGFSFGWGPA
jgi:hypothetical protein